jgi:hypothetical protein
MAVGARLISPASAGSVRCPYSRPLPRAGPFVYTVAPRSRPNRHSGAALGMIPQWGSCPLAGASAGFQCTAKVATFRILRERIGLATNEDVEPPKRASAPIISSQRDSRRCLGKSAIARPLLMYSAGLLVSCLVAHLQTQKRGLLQRLSDQRCRRRR